MAVTTWNTAPDYDQWGIDDYWSCADWTNWHQQLVAKFGKQRANSIWNYAFAESGALSSNLDCRTFNSSFRDYVNKNGLDPFANAGVGAPIFQGYGAVADTTSNVLSGIVDFTSGNSVKTILNVVMIGAVVLIGFSAYKTFKK